MLPCFSKLKKIYLSHIEWESHGGYYAETISPFNMVVLVYHEVIIGSCTAKCFVSSGHLLSFSLEGVSLKMLQGMSVIANLAESPRHPAGRCPAEILKVSQSISFCILSITGFVFGSFCWYFFLFVGFCLSSFLCVETHNSLFALVSFVLVLIFVGVSFYLLCELRKVLVALFMVHSIYLLSRIWEFTVPYNLFLKRLDMLHKNIKTKANNETIRQL